MKNVHSLAVVIGLCGVAGAHDGIVGDHFKIGYYNGHDGSYNAPADPAWPDTLLVDTHPWELDGIFWVVEPTTGGVLGDGWVSDIPGFDSLESADQEFGGHGFFTFEGTGVRAALELLSKDDGVEVLRLDLTPMAIGERLTLGTAPFHAHPFYWVDADTGAGRGDMFEMMFRIVDLNGLMEASEPFVVRLVLGPGCPGDLAEPYAVLDLADIVAFVGRFVDEHQYADFAEPAEVFDLADVVAFVQAFGAGCP